MIGAMALLKRLLPSHTSIAGRVLRLPLKLLPKESVVGILSGPNKGMRWVRGAGITNACWIGNYEQDHLAALPKLVKPGMTVYDVGAHTGYYTLALARLVGEKGRVFAFEPESRNVHYLRRHVQLNGLRNVTIVQAAISDRHGLVGFEDIYISAKSPYLVPTISLDEFLASDHPQPDFLKMDIEGAEWPALHGATAILEKGAAAWMLATHSEQLRMDCQAKLAEYGFRFADFDTVSGAGTSPDFVVLPRAC